MIDSDLKLCVWYNIELILRSEPRRIMCEWKTR